MYEQIHDPYPERVKYYNSDLKIRERELLIFRKVNGTFTMITRAKDENTSSASISEEDSLQQESSKVRVQDILWSPHPPLSPTLYQVYKMQKAFVV